MASSTCSITRLRTSWSAGNSNGAVAKTFQTGSRATATSCSFRLGTTLRTESEGNVMARKTFWRQRRTWFGGIAGSILLVGLTLASPQAAQDPQAAVNSAFEQFRNLKEGKNADY